MFYDFKNKAWNGTFRVSKERESTKLSVIDQLSTSENISIKRMTKIPTKTTKVEKAIK